MTQPPGTCVQGTLFEQITLMPVKYTEYVKKE